MGAREPTWMRPCPHWRAHVGEQGCRATPVPGHRAGWAADDGLGPWRLAAALALLRFVLAVAFRVGN
jgi:hypothetical protein